jgi:hypothetical protein
MSRVPCDRSYSRRVPGRVSAFVRRLECHRVRFKYGFVVTIHSAGSFIGSGSNKGITQPFEDHLGAHRLRAYNSQNAVADLFLVNIQANVIHLFHGEPPWCDSESAFALSSAFSTKRSLTYAFKQLGSYLPKNRRSLVQGARPTRSKAR